MLDESDSIALSLKYDRFKPMRKNELNSMEFTISEIVPYLLELNLLLVQELVFPHFGYGLIIWILEISAPAAFIVEQINNSR